VEIYYLAFGIACHVATVMSLAALLLFLSGDVPPAWTRSEGQGLGQAVMLDFGLFGLWLSPQMSLDRLMLALLLTVNTILGARSVDRKFVIYYGDAYAERQHDVPLLIPRLMPRRNADRPDAGA
jgi:hypothetical protein